MQSIETQVGFLVSSERPKDLLALEGIAVHARRCSLNEMNQQVESGRLSAPDADLIKSKVRQASVVGGADTLVTSLSQVQLDPNQNSQPNNVAAGAVHSHQQQRSNRVVPPIPTKPGSLRSSEPPAPAAVAPPAPSEPKKQLARALWDYNSQTPGDLSFAKNDTVEILREENEHWFFGQCGPHQGLFPSNCTLPGLQRLKPGACAHHDLGFTSHRCRASAGRCYEPITVPESRATTSTSTDYGLWPICSWRIRSTPTAPCASASNVQHI